MGRDIDFSKGGYGGDSIEEAFKPYTTDHLEYWWHFREVLRPVAEKSNPFCKRIDGQSLSDDEHRELIALALTNYAVYTGFAEALWFHIELKARAPQQYLFDVRRSWKALYSSLYSSFNALSNVVCVVAFLESPFGDRPGRIWNWTPTQAYNKAMGKGANAIYEPIQRCQERLEIRDHLDHYWTIWQCFAQGTFMIDRNFSKGYIALDPKNDVQCDLDAVQLADEHLLKCAEDFNSIYKEFAVTGGYLDQYLLARGWYIDYTGYAPHNGARPLP